MSNGILAGTTGLVTGGASGIGLAIAEVAVLEGARIVIGDIDERAGRAAAAHVRDDFGDQCTFQRCDVSNESDVEQLVSVASSSGGGLDFAVNNAASGTAPGHLHELSDSSWTSLISVDLRGVFLCMKHELAAFMRGGGGSIVNIGSMAGVNGLPLSSSYAAAKGGVIALTKSAAAEYAPFGIRVNVVNPGMVLTPGVEQFLTNGSELARRAIAAHALGRAAEPAEIANVACFLASSKASFVTGEAVAVDGGTQVKAATYPL